MSKTKFLTLFLVIFFSLFLAPVVWAQDVNAPLINDSLVSVNAPLSQTVNSEVTAKDLGVNLPKILPTNPFYFIKEWWRGLKLGLTFNLVNKEELRLQQANERLVEINELFNQPVDPQTEKVINKALVKYRTEVDIFKKEAVDLKQQIQNNEQIKKLLEKSADSEFKSQYLLNELGSKEDLSAEVKNSLQQSMQSSLNNLVNTVVLWEKGEDLKQGLSDVLSGAGNLRQMYNLETLKNLGDKVSGQAKEAVAATAAKVASDLNNSLSQTKEDSQSELLQKFLQLKPSEAVVKEVLEFKNISDKVKKQVQAEQQGKLETQNKDAAGALKDTMDLFQLKETK